MPRKKRGNVGIKRKYHYIRNTKTDETNENPSSESTVSTEYGECDVFGSSTYTSDSGIQTVKETNSTAECGMQTVSETNEVETQTSETENDHMYAKSYKEMETETCVIDVTEREPNSEVIIIGESDSYSEIEEVHVEVEDVSITVESEQFRTLASEIKEAASKRDYGVSDTENNITLIRFYSLGSFAVKYTVTFDNCYHCTLLVHRKPIERSHKLWLDLPVLFTSLDSVLKLLDRLESMNICCGNPDAEFQTLVPIGAVLSNQDKETMAYREGDFGARKSCGETYSSTIRSIKCEMITNRKVKCVDCGQYEKALKKRTKRLEVREKVKKNLSHSTFKHKDMTRDELVRKLNEQKREIVDLQHTVDKLRRQFSNSIREKGIEVQNHEHFELKSLMASCTEEFQKSFPDSNCRQRLFWEQQAKFSSKDDARGMRWHPMIIRWCLFIRQKSEKAYEAITESGFINLPSSRTLFDYSHFLTSELGLQPDVMKLAKSEAEKNGLYTEEWRKNVGLLFDEIKIRQDLVYDKHTGELIGYCNLGDIGNQMLAFETDQSKGSQDLARYVLVVMMRSVCSKLCFPLCAFAAKSITADFIYPIMWQIVSIVQLQLRLKVLFFTCDGATPNRRFFNMHRVGNEEVVHRTENPNLDDTYIYFISDVPHLLKTLRNNISNSYSHNQTRRLWMNGKDISWMHIVRLFEEHCEISLYSPCPNLTRKHMHLASFNYMKVNLAAQVLSDSVGNAISDLYGQETSETVTFIKTFNKFFDCLNVRSLFEGRNKRNDNLKPYRSVEDPRLHFLTVELPQYLNEWERQVNERPGNFTRTQRASMLLTYQTLYGVKMSVHSVSECVKYLLNQGASFVLTHSFNQDPLEHNFGHYRHKAGSNNNPSVYEVRNTLSTMRAVNSQAIAPKRGNVQRGHIDNDTIDNSKVPRRK